MQQFPSENINISGLSDGNWEFVEVTGRRRKKGWNISLVLGLKVGLKFR